MVEVCKPTGTDPPEAPNGLPASPSDPAAQILSEIQALRSEVADLRAQLDSRAEKADSRLSIRSLKSRLERPRTRISQFLTTGSRRDWEPPRSRLLDLIALTILTVSGFLLRFVNLTSIPPGMHGDEAFASLLTRRLLNGEHISVFTGQAAGNPTGQVYLLIPFVKWIDDPVFAARFISVLGGTIAIVALYVLVRRNAGFSSAVAATFLFVVSGWAIQFARIGFVTGNWLPFSLIGAIAIFEAIRRQHWTWWLLAGALVSSPIYIYNGATPIVLVTLPVVIAAIVGVPATLLLCAAVGFVLAPSPITGVVVATTLLIVAFDPKVRHERLG